MSTDAARQEKKQDRMAQFIDRFTEWSLNWVPESMVFVFALSIVVFFLAWGLGHHTPLQLVDDYVKGFWVLLTFAMQLSLLLITGFAVADSKLIKNGLIKLVDWPQTRTTTILMYVWCTGILWWFHWGLGTMGAIIVGRQIAIRKQEMKFHYPFLAAIAFAGNQLSNGPSQAAQLFVATPGNMLEKFTGGIVPLTQTTFAPQLLVINVLLFIGFALLMIAVVPKKENSTPISPELIAELTKVEPQISTESLRPAERWERSRILQSILALGGLLWIGKFLYFNGIGKLDLNNLNFILFILALLLHGSPRSFINSVKAAVPSTYGILIQFPLYAGIFGLISGSGLTEIIAHFFVSISTHTTYPLIVFLYTGLLDVFVPSAGSKFIIEAPYIVPAGKQLGISAAQVVNAYTAGSLWANLIVPFWALPTIAAFRVKFQDILPFTFMIWVMVLIIYGSMFLLFPNGF